MKRQTLSLVLLLILAFSIRILVSIFANDIIDVQNYWRVAEIIRRNGPFSLYVDTPGIYPYPPIWVWSELFANMAHTAGLMSFSMAVRLPSILADVGTTAVIWFYFQELSPNLYGRSLSAGMLYALNPIPIIITGLHGQFDAIPIFFAVFAIYLWSIKRRWLWSSLALGVAIAFKSFPVLLLAPLALQLASLSKRIRFAVIALAPVTIILLPYFVRNTEALVRELFGYRGSALLGFLVPIRSVYVPFFGHSFPAETTSVLISWSAYLFLVLYVLIVIGMDHDGASPFVAATTIFALFYFSYAGIAPQYLLWILPFIIVAMPSLRWPIIYTISGTLALVGFYQYAVPDVFPLAFHWSYMTKQMVYGLFGTAWWITCGLIVIECMKLSRRQVRSLSS